MTVFRFEGHPESSLTVLLFRDVTNSKALREAIVAAKVSPEFAFVNAAMVLGLLPLQLAAHKALTNQARGRLLSRTVHSELVYNLSGSKHIGESLRRFGIGDDTTALLVARFGATPEDLSYVRGLVEGREVPLAELEEVTDKTLVNKFFKVMDQELAVGSVEEAIACRIAVRDCA